MYRCDSCGVLVPAGMRASWVTTKVRRRVYPFRASAIPVAGKGKKRRRKDDKGGQGWERVDQIKVCDTCFDRLSSMEPEVVGSDEPEVINEVEFVAEEAAAEAV